MKANLSNLSFLIVEDEQMLLELMFEEFEGAGADVTSCSTGIAALETFKSRSFDAIVTDIRMPDGDGLWLLREICSFSDNPPKVFLCSGTELKEEDIDMPCVVKIFRKPIRISEMMKEIETSFQ